MPGKALQEIGVVSQELVHRIQNISAQTVEQREVAKASQSMTDILKITEQTTAGTKQTAVSIGH